MLNGRYNIDATIKALLSLLYGTKKFPLVAKWLAFGSGGTH